MHTFNSAPLFGIIKLLCMLRFATLLLSSTIRSFVMSPMPHALGRSSTEIENKQLVKQYTITSVTTNQVKCVTLIIHMNRYQMSGVITFFGIVRLSRNFVKHKIISSIESPDTFLSGLNPVDLGVLIRSRCVIFSNGQYC